MERVMLNKITWLSKHTDWEIMIVTTDQKGKAPFFPIPEGVKSIDLDINYSDDNQLNTLGKIKGYLKRRKLHKTRLTNLLMKEKADIVVSLFPSESSFLPSIKDGSKKILELHFNKFFRLQYGRTGLYGLINKWRTKQDEKLVRRFDKFVILTEEDKEYWGDTGNIIVIPNAAIVNKISSHENEHEHISYKSPQYENERGNCEKRVIAVGRLDYQKGFDRLIDAWGIIQEEIDLKDWRLDIYGQGEWQQMLEQRIKEKKISKTAHINPPTKNIFKEYQKSAFLVMSSHYEGFPMVMIEAMSQGLPVVTYDFKCGPKDIIENEKNGFLIDEGNVEGLAMAMIKMMKDETMRKKMANEAKKVTERFSEERIMGMWVKLFDNLMGK